MRTSVLELLCSFSFWIRCDDLVKTDLANRNMTTNIMALLKIPSAVAGCIGQSERVLLGLACPNTFRENALNCAGKLRLR